MYCEKCGAEIDNDTKFCPNCGCSAEKVIEVEPIPMQEKKYCSKCGEQIHKDAVICPKCGCYTEEGKKTNSEYSESKTGIGVIMALFLGLIGLLIGIALYPSGTVSRTSFVKAWIMTYVVCILICLFLMILVFSFGVYAFIGIWLLY